MMDSRPVLVDISATWRELKGARPMATIVLVHGIDNQRESADLIESSWLPALAGGVRLAGRGDLADRLWPPRSRPDSIDCRAAYYGDLFRSPDQQGAGDDLRDLSADQAALAEALALEWLERVDERVPPEIPTPTRPGSRSTSRGSRRRRRPGV
jgi:hypothetical protein